MPMTFPLLFIKGPPEFPLFMEASVWMYSTMVIPRPDGSSVSLGIGRPFAEIIPNVTECPTASELPIAIVQSPTSTAAESPKRTDKSSFPSGGSILSSAMSVFGSLPTTVASYVSPRENTTRIAETVKLSCATT